MLNTSGIDNVLTDFNSQGAQLVHNAAAKLTAAVTGKIAAGEWSMATCSHPPAKFLI